LTGVSRNFSTSAKATDRGIEEFLHLCKGDDLVELGSYLCPAHSEDGTIEKNVLSSCKLRVETGAHLQKTGDTAVDVDLSRGRFGNA